MDEKIKQLIKDSIKVKTELLNNIDDIKKIAIEIINLYKEGRKVIVFGNGGSAADAQHLAGELVCRFEKDRPGLNCIALSTDTSVITAIGNDYGFDKIFSKQIEAVVKPGDLVIGISTSGNSKNVIEAILEAKKRKAITVGFTGFNGGKLKSICDYCISAPSNITARIQECHTLIIHIICSLVEQELFKP